MKEKIIVGIVSALLGGMAGNLMEAATTRGRLTSIENAVLRIEARVDSLQRKP